MCMLSVPCTVCLCVCVVGWMCLCVFVCVCVCVMYVFIKMRILNKAIKTSLKLNYLFFVIHSKCLLVMRMLVGGALVFAVMCVWYYVCCYARLPAYLLAYYTIFMWKCLWICLYVCLYAQNIISKYFKSVHRSTCTKNLNTLKCFFKYS